jgi:hypothetical protein
MRDEFLSRTEFPLDEDSRISGSHLFYLFESYSQLDFDNFESYWYSFLL